MDDVVGNKFGFNPINHFELRANLAPFHSVVDGSVYGNPSQETFIAYPVNSQNLGGMAWEPAFTAAQLSSWSIDAFNAFHDQIPVKVSLPNFLWELQEMKGMIPSIDRSSISKTASNNFLAWNFGVAPFVSDMKAIVSLADSASKSIEHLLMNQGKTTTLSFNRDTKDFPPLEVYMSIDGHNGSTLGHSGYHCLHLKRLSARVILHIGGKLTQDLEGLRGDLAQLKALAASSGFNKPARAIWNALPYSFVVDWFFSVGKLLDSLAIQPFGGEYTIKDVYYSLKSEAVWAATQVYHPNYQEYFLGNIDVESYRRVKGFPATSLLLTDGLLSPTQLTLALAMLEQKRR